MLDAKTPLELYKKYCIEDQKLFTAQPPLWDYDDPDQVPNKVRAMLEVAGTERLTEDEVEWRNQIIWFWYHHAISVAGWKRDKDKQRYFSEKAMEYEDPSNMLTRTMFYLVHDRVEDAEEWVRSKEGDADFDTAQEMLENYKSFGELWLSK